MVVLITNLTDGPDKRPREVRIFNTRLLPGNSMRIQAQYVDSKMRALEEAGHISIGAVPAWYADHKSRRTLSADEVVASRQRAKKHAKAKADAKKKFLSKKPSSTAPAPAPAPVEKKLDLSDQVQPPQDEVNSTESTSGKRNKRR